MRNPHNAVNRIPRAVSTGRVVQASLLTAIRDDPSLLEPVQALLRQQPSQGFTENQVLSARLRVSALLQASTDAPPRPGLQPSLFQAWADASGDPDTVLAQWLRTGAPLGILNAVAPTGIFPTVPEASPNPEQIQDLASLPQGWVNYRSSEDEPIITDSILQSMVSKQWATCCDTWDHLVSELGSDQITLNKLALVSKQKPDGTWKHRVVWDLRRSQVNASVRQGERVVLPRLLDVVNDICHLARASPDSTISMLGTHIADAFHQVPLDPSEWRFTVASFQGRFYVFRVLVFGSALSLIHI